MSQTLSRVNSSAATLTKNRTEGSVTPNSGMCVTCVDGCIGMCEIGKSAYRGHEVIYPQPFGVITTASEKVYPVDYSHFNIMGTAVGAHGIEADSDKAIFPNVNLEVHFGHDKGLKFRYPWIIPGIGSTNIAKNNWEGLAIGSALAGTGLTIGENVVGMDPEARARERQDLGHGGSQKKSEALPGSPARRLRRHHRPGQRGGHEARGSGIRHPGARRGSRGAQVGPGREEHRRRGQDHGPQEGPASLRTGIRGSARIPWTPTSSRPSSGDRSRSSSGTPGSAW